MWNPASMGDMMSGNLDITEAMVLDHITAIFYIGQCSAGEGLTVEEAQACIDILAHTSNGGTWLLNVSSKP